LAHWEFVLIVGHSDAGHKRRYGKSTPCRNRSRCLPSTSQASAVPADKCFRDIPVTTLSNDEIWSALLGRLASYARTRVQKLFPSTGFPPFFSFSLDAIEKDAASGRPGPASAPLMDTGLVIHALSEPEMLESADAIRLAKAAVKLDYRLDDQLLNRLADLPRESLSKEQEAKAARVLEIVDAISDCQRLVMPLMKFLKLPQSQLRSKAVKLISRARRNSTWAETILTDPDPRVRSNLIDGLAEQSGDQIDGLLRKGAADKHHRVAVGALLQLYLRGDQASFEKLTLLASESDPPHRRAAEWALGQIEAAKPPASPEPQPAESEPTALEPAIPEFAVPEFAVP